MADFEKVYSIKFSTGNATRSLTKLQKRLDKIEKTTVDIGKTFRKSIGNVAVDSVKKLDDELADVGKTAKRTRQKIKTLGTSGAAAITKVSKATQRAKIGMSRFGDTLSTAGRKVTTHVALPIAAAGLAFTKMSLEMNKSMANVSTMLSGGTDKVIKFKKEIQDLSIASGKGTGGLADAFYEVNSAFGENKDSIEQLTIANKAGVAGRAETLDAVKLLSAVTKGYGDTSKEALSKVSDLAFKTVELGQTTFPELASAMGRVIPLASAMNTSQNELFGTMATLTGVTGTASEVTTQLSSVYSAFMKPSKALTALAKEQGHASASAMMKAEGLAKTIKILAKETGGEADAVAKLITRKEGQIAVLALAGGQADTYSAKLEKMKDVVGATDRAYKKQTEGINKAGHEFKKTQQRMIVFAQRMGDRLLPILEKILHAIEPVLKKLEALDQQDMDDIIKAITAFGKTFIYLQAAMATVKISSFISSLIPLQAQLAATGAAGGGKLVGGVMGKLNSAGPLIAAAIAGWGIGSLISDTIQGAIAKSEKKSVAAENEGMGTTFGSGKMSKSELQKEQRRLQDLEAKQNKNYGVGVFGSKGLAEQRRRRQVTREALASVQSNLGTVDRRRQESQQKKYGGGSGFSDEWQISSQSVNSGGSTTVGATTIIINGAKDARSVAKEVNRAIDNRIKRGNNRRGAAEQ